MNKMKVIGLMPLYAAILLLVSACATSGGQSLTIDTRHVPAVEYLPDEVTAMLEDLGYTPIPDTSAERLAQSFDIYTMQFRAKDDHDVRIDVHMRLVDKITAIQLYKLNEKKPGIDTLQRYQVLKQRVESEFGVDNVKHGG